MVFSLWEAKVSQANNEELAFNKKLRSFSICPKVLGFSFMCLRPPSSMASGRCEQRAGELTLFPPIRPIPGATRNHGRL